MRAKEALEGKNSNSSTPLSQVKPESSNITLKPDSLWGKTGYKVVEEVMDYYQWRKIPVSQEWLNGLARNVITWAMKDDSYHIISFCREYGLSVYSFNDYADKYPILGNAKRDAQEVIAARRDVDALKMKLSGSVMLGTQTYHSKSFSEHKKDVASWADKDRDRATKVDLHFYDQPEPEDKSGSDNSNTPK